MELAKELGIAKSTVESIINSGHMTLHTAVQISERLGIPLDILLSDEPLDQEFDVVRWLMKGIAIYDTLSAEQQEKIAVHVNGIMDTLRDTTEAHE